MKEAAQTEVLTDGDIAKLYIEMLSEMKTIIEVRHI